MQRAQRHHSSRDSHALPNHELHRLRDPGLPWPSGRLDACDAPASRHRANVQMLGRSLQPKPLRFLVGWQRAAPEMIYIVSGFMRSGTSMMMKALIAGGMDAAYSEARDERMNKRWGDLDEPNGYRPNREYFELDTSDYSDPSFPLAYEGKLLKCLWGGLSRMKNCQARVIFMRRPGAEVKRSMFAAFGTAPEMAASDFDRRMDVIADVAMDRRSFISFDQVWYEDALAHPLTVFKHLKDVGWPISPHLAAAIPEVSSKRHRAA